MAKSNMGYVLGGVGLLALYFFMTQKKATAATGGQVTLPVGGPAAVPGSMATTAGALSATNAIWSNLTPTTGPYSGFVNFPTGSQAAAGLLQWATDGVGNYYTQWAGHIYLVNVAQPDSSGNYPAGQQIS